jgi:hypothetical protein
MAAPTSSSHSRPSTLADVHAPDEYQHNNSSANSFELDVDNEYPYDSDLNTESSIFQLHEKRTWWEFVTGRHSWRERKTRQLLGGLTQGLISSRGHPSRPTEKKRSCFSYYIFSGTSAFTVLYGSPS